MCSAASDWGGAVCMHVSSGAMRSCLSAGEGEYGTVCINTTANEYLIAIFSIDQYLSIMSSGVKCEGRIL